MLGNFKQNAKKLYITCLRTTNRRQVNSKQSEKPKLPTNCAPYNEKTIDKLQEMCKETLKCKKGSSKVFGIRRVFSPL